jgi:hypothetical protein
LPKAVRSGGLGIIYALSTCVFGGSTQLAIKALTDVTGSALAPAWYMTGAVLAGGVAMALMQESAPIKLCDEKTQVSKARPGPPTFTAGQHMS